MNPSLEVSVICPTYNSAPFVVKTLATVLQQTVSPLELIVCDDGSTDDTCAVVERFLQSVPLPWLLLKNRHQGPGAARNAAIRVARGNWIAFIDSDDLWLPTKLEEFAAASKRNPTANFFCHNAEYHRLNGARLALDFCAGYNPRKPLAHQLMVRNLFTPTAVVCRKDVLFAVTLFDEQLQSAQDYELWFKLSEHIRPCMLPAILSCYIERRGNITSRNAIRHLRNNVTILFRHRKKATFRQFATAIGRTLYEFLERLTKRLSLPRFGRRTIGLQEIMPQPGPLPLPRRLFAGSSVLFRFSSRLGATAGIRPGALRVLLYHDIPDDQAAAFAAQLRWLSRRWSFVSPDEFAALIISDSPPTQDSLLLTFDDAYASNFKATQGILNPMGIKALYFVPTDFVAMETEEDVRRFIADRMFDHLIAVRGVPARLRPMTVAQLAILLDQGHAIGSHTRSHARLSRVNVDAELKQEIGESGRILHDKLGTAVRHFAYPFGDAFSISPRALAAAAGRYDYVYSGVRGNNRRGVSPFAIRRDAMQPTYPVEYVDTILLGGLDLIYRRQRQHIDKLASLANRIHATT